MIHIFQPILSHTLIYINDILLFSPNPQAHHQLLYQFANIIWSNGTMLSSTKMEIGKPEIDFVGMHIHKGQYTLQPHISTALQKFLDKVSSPKEIQQFIGLINYMVDFIPHIAQHRSILTTLLKKKPPVWNTTHLKAIQTLKTFSQNLPPLQIPNHHTTWILQTDASDLYWGAILLEEINGKRKICGYKSGAFSPAKSHYHSTFKKILTIKRGIKKFQFHLIGCSFIVEMDSSSFPKMLQFKQKSLPNAQLLRWAVDSRNGAFKSSILKAFTMTLLTSSPANPTSSNNPYLLPLPYYFLSILYHQKTPLLTLLISPLTSNHLSWPMSKPLEVPITFTPFYPSNSNAMVGSLPIFLTQNSLSLLLLLFAYTTTFPKKPCVFFGIYLRNFI